MKCEKFEICKRETKGNSKLCGPCYSKEYRKNNRDRIKIYNKMVLVRDKDKTSKYKKLYRDKVLFGGNRLKALKRDDYKCTKCGMTQEEHIILTGRELHVDHVDGKGRCSKIKNHELSNLKTICHKCHPKKDKPMYMKRKYGGLLKQDNSKYRYPQIRKILDSKKRKLGTITEAKHELAKEMGMSYWTMDHMYYERKNAVSVDSGKFKGESE